MEYNHIIEYDIEKDKITIWRQFANMNKILYTEIYIPRDATEEEKSDFLKNFSENIFLDIKNLRDFV